jgi:vacuolar-type H+-ATPase subunit H
MAEAIDEYDDTTGETQVVQEFDNLFGSEPDDDTDEKKVMAASSGSGTPSGEGDFDESTSALSIVRHTDTVTDAATDAPPADAASRDGSPQPRAEFTTAFDIIDAMSRELDEAKTPLFTPSTAKIDREAFERYLTELKGVLPVQLERASALMRESERRLDSAQDQSEAIVRDARSDAEAIVAKANEQAEFLAGHQNVVALAEERARDIVAKAQASANKMAQGADEYSTQVLQTLSEQVTKFGRDINAGLSVLHDRQEKARNAHQ